MMPLEPAEYWQLRALTADLERVQLEAALVETRLEAARTRRQAYWLELAARYGIAPDRRYGLRDDTCALMDVEPTPA